MNARDFRRARCWPVALLSLALVAPAHAHMTVEGAGDFGNGALHPLMTPAHALILLALGLWLGQRVPLDLKIPLRTFAPVSAVALFLSTRGWLPAVYPPALSGVALVIAILVGAGVPLPRWIFQILCAVSGAVIALDSTVETGSAFVVTKTLIGTWFSMNAVVCYIAICASNGAEKKWAVTAIRVVGSWIVAISVMMLAFALRKP